HAFRAAQGVDGLLEGGLVELVADGEQGADGRVEDLAAEVRHGIAGADRELTETGTGREVLRELQLEGFEAFETECTAESEHGGFADVRLGGEVIDAHA